MAGRIASLLSACALALALAGTSAAQAPAPARSADVCETIWQVTASWSDHLFFWVFWRDGRYTDTDGPTGSWKVEGAQLTLVADSGFLYRATLTAEDAQGAVFQGANNAGTFTAHRTYAGNCARPGA